MPETMNTKKEHVKDVIGLALNCLLVVGVLFIPTRKARHPEELKTTKMTRQDERGTLREADSKRALTNGRLIQSKE